VASVLAQTLPPERFEIIVVDDGSRIPAERVLQTTPASGRLRVLRQTQQGWARARQLGAQQARGEILVFLDDDCRAPAHWLEAYDRVYAAHPGVNGVGGALRPGAE
jgi:glycosyltransferase involved in cell wall biosynthesis